MSVINREEIKKLVEEKNEMYISMYVPTGKTGADGKQGQIRLKNVLRDVQEQLIKAGYKKQGIEELTDSVQKLVADTVFWSYQSGGLAIFLSENGMCYYQVPIEVPELAIVSDAFHLQPIMPLLVEDGLFYILCLNQKHVSLLACTKHFYNELQLEDVPTDIETYLKYDNPQKQLQFSTHTPGGGGTTRAASYHGHSVSDEDKINLLRFFNEIDKGVRKAIGNEEVPMVLAGVEYYLPMYKEASGYKALVDGGVIGSTEQKQVKEVHAEAWSMIEPLFMQKRTEAISRFHELEGTGKTLNQCEEISEAAELGRIETMFVIVGEQESINRDAFNEAAIQTYLQGGTVFALPPEEMPDQHEAIVIARY